MWTSETQEIALLKSTIRYADELLNLLFNVLLKVPASTCEFNKITATTLEKMNAQLSLFSCAITTHLENTKIHKWIIGTIKTFKIVDS
jgi:hypothetical protein